VTRLVIYLSGCTVCAVGEFWRYLAEEFLSDAGAGRVKTVAWLQSRTAEGCATETMSGGVKLACCRQAGRYKNHECGPTRNAINDARQLSGLLQVMMAAALCVWQRVWT